MLLYLIKILFGSKNDMAKMFVQHIIIVYIEFSYPKVKSK